MSKAVAVALALVFMFAQSSLADELTDLKRRVEELEKRVENGTVVTDEPGHKRLHPVHSIYGLKVSGSITITGQSATEVNDTDPQGDAAISADLALESPVGEKGRAVLVLDFQRGEGIKGLPSFFVGPNGSGTGPNADLEGFNDTSVHVTQVYYEHDITPALSFSVGQLDITGYFDSNEYANDERAQFMANAFVNSPAIEFGGSEDFYSPGLRVTWMPAENIGVTVGAFEGDGDYNEAFDKPFFMAEVDAALRLAGRDGNYRLYYWYRHGRPDADATTPVMAENLANPGDITLLDAHNSGAGISVDQSLTDALGVWLRAGVQREKVAQFDRFVSGGVNVGGDLFGRPNDNVGFGYAATFIGGDYEEYQKTADPAFEAGTEHYLELYYNYALTHAAPDEGFHITPDVQFVVNPGGNEASDNVFIYGVRLQGYF